MRSANIITAFIVFIIICVTIFLRGPLTTIFTNSPSQKAINEAKESYKTAVKDAEEAEKSFEALEVELEAKKQARMDARIKRAGARVNLSAIKNDYEMIAKLREEALGLEGFKVEVIKINPQDVPSGLALSGKAEAGRRVNVTAETSGRVISNPLRAGTPVVKGDILCQIDPGTTRAQFEQAQAAFINAQNQLNIETRLQARGLASEASVIAARANFEQAQAASEQMREQVENLQIKAPFDGKLVADTAEIGSLMAPGASCATLIALDTIKIAAFVAERNINDIKLSAPVLAIFNNVKEPITGTITSIGSSADPVTRAYPVEVMLSSNENEILDGTSVKIYVSIDGVKGYLIPQNAVTLDSEGTIGVMVYRDNQAIFAPVNIELETPEGTWVTGLEGNVDLIIQGQEYAKDGIKVEAYYTEKVAQ